MYVCFGDPGPKVYKNACVTDGLEYMLTVSVRFSHSYLKLFLALHLFDNRHCRPCWCRGGSFHLQSRLMTLEEIAKQARSWSVPQKMPYFI